MRFVFQAFALTSLVFALSAQSDKPAANKPTTKEKVQAATDSMPTGTPVEASSTSFQASPFQGNAQRQGSAAQTDRARRGVEREVRHELVMLPYYGVFDNLAFIVDGTTVTLQGQVVRPTLRTAAERVVKDIEGVEKVVNNIEVLPVSKFDDDIRLAAARAIFGHTALNRYALQAVPPIHIIVKNGRITLEGVVAAEMDRNIANIQANGVPGVMGVTNNLRVEQRDDK